MTDAEQQTAGWQRLEQLFVEAVELPGGMREEFVERETRGDDEMRHRLRELLRHDSDAAARIQRTVRMAAEAIAAPIDFEGWRAGPYRVVREIGRGGMGIVFEALRDDDEYRKVVALKIAPRWGAAASGRAEKLHGERFRHERQILASLEHPNIARFLDGGTYQGIPYFAMELVEGVPLTEYAEQRGLKLRERIELFRRVCAAVHYAHQNLVVHRDLKPGNILVTPGGVPKLLDFGIAKLLAPETEGWRTATGAAPWTPDYASPEQVRALPITTRTDIYSLGLILFELLTGVRAQVVDTSSPLAIHRSVCEKAPPGASRCAELRGERALARQLRGDLDIIIATAIHKEAERRYNSVAALSEDLDRYLKGQPVEARPGARAYRAWKLARRHRTIATASLLLAVTLAGGIAAAAYQARRAERRFQQVRKLANAMMLGVQDRLQNLAGATETREWAVRTGLEYLDDLARDAEQDRPVLEELASGYLKIGDVQGYPMTPSLGQREAALASYRKAEEIARGLAGRGRDAAVRRLFAKCEQRIGAILRTQHRTAAGIESYRRALAEIEPLYTANPANQEDASLLAIILNTLGQAESAAGQTAEASHLWLRAAEVTARSAEEHGDLRQARFARTGKYVIRARMYAGDLQGAEQVAREGVRVREAAVAEQPGNAGLQRSLANSYGDFGYVYFHSWFLSFGDRERAAPLFEKSLAIVRKLAAADPNNATAQSDLNIAETDSCAAANSSNPANAVLLCQAGLAIADRLPQVSADDGLAQLSIAFQRLGRRRDAMDAIEKAMRIREELHRQDPEHYVIRQQLLRGRIQMAGLLEGSGDGAGALEQNRQAVGLAEDLVRAVPENLLARRDLADAYESLGNYYRARDPVQARGWYRKSLELWTAWPTFARSGLMDQARRTQAERLLAAVSE